MALHRPETPLPTGRTAERSRERNVLSDADRAHIERFVDLLLPAALPENHRRNARARVIDGLRSLPPDQFKGAVEAATRNSGALEATLHRETKGLGITAENQSEVFRALVTAWKSTSSQDATKMRALFDVVTKLPGLSMPWAGEQEARARARRLRAMIDADNERRRRNVFFDGDEPEAVKAARAASRRETAAAAGLGRRPGGRVGGAPSSYAYAGMRPDAGGDTLARLDAAPHLRAAGGEPVEGGTLRRGVETGGPAAHVPRAPVEGGRPEVVVPEGEAAAIPVAAAPRARVLAATYG